MLKFSLIMATRFASSVRPLEDDMLFSFNAFSDFECLTSYTQLVKRICKYKLLDYSGEWGSENVFRRQGEQIGSVRCHRAEARDR
jgi:hypothetical protein